MINLFKKYLALKLTLAFFALSAVVGFAAQNETVGRALNILRPDVKVQISGTVHRADKNLAADKVEAVKSGETLDWKINSVNEGSASAQNYRVVGQIPNGTSYVAGSASSDDSAAVSFSIDNGKTFSAEPLIDETQADGTIKKVAAPVAMFTQIQFDWAKELPAQTQFAANYKVRVK